MPITVENNVWLNWTYAPDSTGGSITLEANSFDAGTCTSAAWNDWVTGSLYVGENVQVEIGFDFQAQHPGFPSASVLPSASNRPSVPIPSIVEQSKAAEKAEALLLSILAPEQREEYRKDSKITLEALGKKYELVKKRNGNILELGADGKPNARLCAHIAPPLPDEDNLVAQVLAFRACPELVLSAANRTVIRN